MILTVCHRLYDEYSPIGKSPSSFCSIGLGNKTVVSTQRPMQHYNGCLLIGLVYSVGLMHSVFFVLVQESISPC